MLRFLNAREEIMSGAALKFALAVLAAWRVTHLLASEDGPADLIARWRALMGRGWAGRLMDCFNCLSFWVAAPAALFVTRRPLDWLVTWLAVSGASCLLERLGHQPVVFEQDSQPQEGEQTNVLREESIDAPDHAHAGQNARDSTRKPS